MIDIKLDQPPPPAPPGKSNANLPLILSAAAGVVVLVAALIFWLVGSTPTKRPVPTPVVAEAPRDPNELPEIEIVENSESEMSELTPEGGDSQPKRASILDNASPAVKIVVPEVGKPTTPPEKATPTKPGATPPESKPTEKTVPAPTASKPTPSAPPPVKPASDKLFQGFPTELSLPSPADTTPFRLGTAYPEYTYEAVLLGGELASRNRQAFVLERQGNDDANVWNLFVRDGKPDRKQVAELAVKKGGLYFTWTADAAELPTVTSVRNCVLALAAASSTHKIQLRKKQGLPRLAMLYEKKTYTFSLDDAPRGRDVQIEFDFVTPKTMPRPRFVGRASVSGTGEQTAWADFGVKGAGYLKLQIDAKCDARGLEITMIPWLQFTPDSKPIALTDEALKRFEPAEALQAEQAIRRQLDSLPKPSGKKKTPDPHAAQRAALNKQLSAVKNSAANIAELKKLKKDFANGILKVRAVYQVDKAFIELAASK